jgi:hypothetical protein
MDPGNLPHCERLTDARVWLYAFAVAMRTPEYKDPVGAADDALGKFKLRFPAASSGAEYLEPHMRKS